MIRERIIRQYVLTCDKCGTSYCDCSGLYFMNKDEMVQSAANDGWLFTHYEMKCPDCR